MLTFFEFYEALLTFVLYKLYNDIGVRYPLVTATTVGSLAQSSSNGITGKNLSSIVTAHLRTLSSKDTKPAEKGTITSVVSDATMQNSNSTNTKSKRQAKNAVITL